MRLGLILHGKGGGGRGGMDMVDMVMVMGEEVEDMGDGSAVR